MFARWQTSGKRLKEEFKKITSDKTTVKDENAVWLPQDGAMEITIEHNWHTSIPVCQMKYAQL